MRNGRRARHPWLQLVALHTGAPVTRIGLSVGKQIGGAVVRNRLKRRLRMIVRDLHWRQGYDVVILPRAGADSASFEEITGAVLRNAEQLRLLDTSNA
ncbi:MAG: ribonuclease P protein component [Dehalococcoidia bacterium]|nr:ribonuclease P protein component [Dehalococcoidia bacterium]